MKLPCGHDSADLPLRFPNAVYRPGGCPTCFVALTDPKARKAYNLPGTMTPVGFGLSHSLGEKCPLEGEVVRFCTAKDSEVREMKHVRKCSHGENISGLTTRAPNDGISGLWSCTGCDFDPRKSRSVSPAVDPALLPLGSPMPVKPLTWACGVTTLPKRKDNLLPQTLASIKRAGFDAPRLFVDAASHLQGDWYERTYNLPVTVRSGVVRPHGNWILSLYELYIREPHADRYIIFQDDVLAVTNLRSYLDSVPFPVEGYWNLFTSPANQELATLKGQDSPRIGFYPSNQFGRGALSLAFSRAGVKLLLGSDHMIERPEDSNRGWKSIDGGVVTAMRKKGWFEYVHNPSLVQHIGRETSINEEVAPPGLQGRAANLPQADAPSFPGEEFDARTLIPGWDSGKMIPT